MHRRLWIAALLIPFAGSSLAGDKVSKIEDFSLRDFRGKEWSLSGARNAKLIVVAFIGNDCPLAKLYAPRLEELSKKYRDRGVEFIAINSNVQDLPTEMAAFARIHGVTFPLLKDPGNTIADRFGAERTPEVFVLDGTQAIRYRGRIDDQYLIGIQRPSATRRDLADALDALLAGKSVAQPTTETIGCRIGRVAKSTGSTEVNYSKHIAPIFQKRCVQCHRPGEIGPFPLTSYTETVGWGETILEVVRENRMPPWHADPKIGHFRNNSRLSDVERDLIAKWVGAGCPEGNPKDCPPPLAYKDGWTIGEPDRVVYMSDKPYPVPAEGVVEYQHIVVDPGFTEDKWVKAAEVRPGNRAVVHHVIVFVRRPNSGGTPFDLELIGGYAPGMPAVVGFPGMAALIPKGSKLVFQMHYTPNGSATQDRSAIGFKFADPSTIKYRARAGMAINVALKIPPHADNHEVVAKYRFPADSLLVTLTPHMHLRGKSFKYELVHVDGRRETILDVPRYDFNWQLRYELKEPLKIPKGTVLICTAHFDNSENNLANPDPNKTVRWGDQTWEEMMIGWFTSATPVAPKSSASPSASPPPGNDQKS